LSVPGQESFMAETTSLVAALAAAQAEFPEITKDQTAHVRSEKGAYTYAYADLASILSAIRPVLARHGIATVQRMRFREGGLVLLTELLFGDEHLTSEMPLPAELRNPQAFGSYLTYAKRYALASLVGVAAEEDDDGATARDAEPARQSPPRQITPPRQPVREDRRYAA
jgi:hypothetical protein